QLIESAKHLEKAGYILLTLGTAQVFEWRETGKLVANNHKFAASQFNERMLSVAEIEEHLHDVIERILTVNPDCKIILTVSPVRHLRKGAVENQRSKSRLILACETLSTHFTQCVYFPAYELLMDDLRDYRFYADDLLHPSALAIDYVREFFFKTFVRESSQQLAEEISKIIFAARHRPFRIDTPEHQSFVRQQINNIEKITGKYPDLNFTSELEHFKAQIST
ncbi:MAG: GSCFA domain-containing protein, partial [Saprospiraceae bacterium]|nr:GSCFA domain-containing protein [Saprospiraceae bacterium]